MASRVDRADGPQRCRGCTQQCRSRRVPEHRSRNVPLRRPRVNSSVVVGVQLPAQLHEASLEVAGELLAGLRVGVRHNAPPVFFADEEGALGT